MVTADYIEHANVAENHEYVVVSIILHIINFFFVVVTTSIVSSGRCDEY